MNIIDLFEQAVIDRENMVQSWKPPLPSYSFFDYLEIFPEARGIAKRELLRQLKDMRTQLKDMRERYNSYYDRVINKASFDQQASLIELRDALYVPELSQLEKEIKRKQFFLSSLNQKPVLGKGVTPQMVLKAREYPLEILYNREVRNGFGICPLHSEKTGSFKIYHKQNRWYCYSCQEGSDTIDYCVKVMKMNFVEAVKYLCQSN